MNEKLIQRTDPKYDEDVVNKRWLDKRLNEIGPSVTLGNDVPIGSILPYPSNTPPTNWLIADGSAISRTVYSDLFGVIGTTYGVGDGSTTFNLPNLKGRIPVGRDSSQTEFDTLAETGGAKTHTLTIPEIPSHSHYAYNSPGGAISFPAYTTKDNGISGTIATTGYATTLTFTGGGQAHNNLQPYIVQNYIIFAQKTTSIIPTNALVINNLTSTSTTDALSANMGKALQDTINNMMLKGKTIIIRKNTTQSIPLSTKTKLTFQTSDTGYDNSLFELNSNDILLKDTRIKTVGVTLLYQQTGSGLLVSYVNKNTTQVAALNRANSDSGTMSFSINATKDDRISFHVFASPATTITSASDWNVAILTILDTI